MLVLYHGILILILLIIIIILYWQYSRSYWGEESGRNSPTLGWFFKKKSVCDEDVVVPCGCYNQNVWVLGRNRIHIVAQRDTGDDAHTGFPPTQKTLADIRSIFLWISHMSAGVGQGQRYQTTNNRPDESAAWLISLTPVCVLFPSARRLLFSLISQDEETKMLPRRSFKTRWSNCNLSCNFVTRSVHLPLRSALLCCRWKKINK